MQTAGTKPVIKRFLSYAREYLRHYLLAVVGIVLVSGASGASAYIVKPVLDDIFIKKDTVMLGILPFAIILVYFAKGAGGYIQAYYTSFIGQDIVRKLRNNLLENMLSLDINFFNRQRSGELISRVTADIGRVQSFVASTVPDLVREGLTIVALMFVVIYQSPHLAFYFLVIMPLAFYPLSLLAKKMKKISHKSQGKISDLTARLSEIFNNVEIIKANNCEKFEVERFAKTNKEYFHLSMKSTRTNQLVSPLMETLGAIAIAVVIITGGHEVIEGKMSVGSFFSFMTALFMLYTPIKRVSNIYNSMQDAIAAGERIFEYLDKRPYVVGGEKELVTRIKKLEFDDVRLSFDDKEALKGVNLTATAGQKIALVGDSGGGKSSCVNLILRFFAPNSGTIRLDGVDANEYTLASIRAKVAVVTQRIYVFNDSVAQNVAYGKEIDRQKVEDALRRANAWEFIEGLPQGMDTVLDEFGVNLSGGQRQRIAIARAIYKDPDILILDEATSALDNKSEEKVQEAIDAFSRDKITIIIAHRLSTIKNADSIAVLRHGKVECMGTHDELLAGCEEYERLYALAGKN